MISTTIPDQFYPLFSFILFSTSICVTQGYQGKSYFGFSWLMKSFRLKSSTVRALPSVTPPSTPVSPFFKVVPTDVNLYHTLITQKSPEYISGQWKALISGTSSPSSMSEDTSVSFEKTEKEIDIIETAIESESLECEFHLTNNLNDSVIFCWVGDDLKLHHYYVINSLNSIKDGSVSNLHCEYTEKGHSFVCFYRSKRKGNSSNIEIADKLPTFLYEIPSSLFVFHIHLKKGNHIRHIVELNNAREEDLTTTTEVEEGKQRRRLRWSSPFEFLNKKKPAKSSSFPATSLNIYHSYQFLTKEDEEVIDTTTTIHYDDLYLEGFLIKYEKNLFSLVPTLATHLEDDLKMIANLLPSKACQMLQETTHIYLNKQLIYGLKKSPTIGDSMCYHPVGGKNWLVKHGLSPEKEGCIEIADVENYLYSCGLWGCGGVLLHELCHAFHNKHCKDGYDNEEIRTVRLTSFLPSFLPFLIFLFVSLSLPSWLFLNRLTK
jgi:hypothetical protein